MTDADTLLPIEGQLYIGQDNLWVWDDVNLASTGAAVTSGTATYVLKDENYATVSSGSGSWYATDTEWQFTIPVADLAAAAIEHRGIYFLELKIVTGSTVTGLRRKKLRAMYQG